MKGHLVISLVVTLFGTLVASLFLGTGIASAIGTYAPGTPPSYCSGTGVAGGECGELRTIAVDSSNGNVYVADAGNSRMEQFAPDGTFIRAFGSDVVASGQHNVPTGGAEICEPANSSPVDVCKKGVTTGTGAFGNPPRGMAVDPLNHVVYVATAIGRLAYFNGTTGEFLGQTEGKTSNLPSTSVNTPENFALLSGLAIDTVTAGGPYLYVTMNASGGKIDKFSTSSSGLTATSYVCQITGTAAPTSVNGTECGGNGVPTHKDGAFEGLFFGTASQQQRGNNLAVDRQGNVFVAEHNGSRHVISQFDKNGDYVKQFQPSGGSPALSATEPRPEALVTLPSGALLVAAGAATTDAGGTRVQEYDPAQITPGIPPVIPSATPLTEFGFGTIGGTVGVATSGVSAVVADRVNKKVWKFAPVPTAPTVVTQAATDLNSKFKATVNGTVNPNLTDITDCHFEYGTTTSYGSSAPCVPAAPGSGNVPVAVSAALTGLSGGTTYHVRLVAASAGGATPGNDVEFTTTLLNKPIVTTTPGATAITQTTVAVAGTVNPNEVLVTDCHVNYGVTAAYGQTAPCVPSPGAGEDPVDVTASLSGLSPATVYHFQVVATNGDGTSAGADQQFETLPNSPSLGTPVVEPRQITAKVTVAVTPNSGTVTDCHFDYGLTTSYGSQKPCSPTPGSGALPVDVSAILTGLQVNTPYHFRVVATNSGGTTTGADQVFTTLPPNRPLAITEGAVSGVGETFTLQGSLDPEGLTVDDCHFAYGTTSAYGKTTPCVPSASELGDGNSAISVTASTEPLEPGTIYHFRLVAANLRGDAEGKDRTFTTEDASTDDCANAAIRAAQGIDVLMLPDCMALEQVSPVNKGSQHARIPAAVSSGGNRVLFSSAATLGTCPNISAFGDAYVASRGEGGWATDCVSLSYPLARSTGIAQASFTRDMSRWITSGALEGGVQFVEQYPGGNSPVSPVLHNLTNVASPLLLGASVDHSHLYLRPEVASLRDGTFLPGDPVPAGAGEDFNLYVAEHDPGGQPSLVLAARDRDGKVWGGNCGARLGGMEEEFFATSNLPNGSRNQGAISADGSKIYFSTRPDQAPAGDCTEAHKKRIMVREETPTGPKIEELIASECDRVSPACAGHDGDDIYQGASVNQSMVYFTTNRQLADTDLDGSGTSCVGNNPPPNTFNPVAGCDLYLYDSNKGVGERLTQVSSGDSTDPTPGAGANVVNGIAGISADGSHVYFVAAGVLTTDTNPEGEVAVSEQPNFYAWNAATGSTSFIGKLAASDGRGGGGGELWNSRSEAYSVPLIGTDSQGHEVGGDGHVVLFRSKAPLVAGDSDGGRVDVYRYDAAAQTLDRVSKASPGGADNGPFDAAASTERGTGTDYEVLRRSISEDGQSVVFTTIEGLLPGDVNGVEDAYMWREGQLFRLPGSARVSLGVRPNSPVISTDGSAVAYHSSKQLVPSDGDGAQDVYVARVNGGYPLAAPEPDCEGESCQGSPGALADGPVAGTASFFGAGNVGADRPPPKCRKGKVRKHGRCVKRQRSRKKAHRHGAGRQGRGAK